MSQPILQLDKDYNWTDGHFEEVLEEDYHTMFDEEE